MNTLTFFLHGTRHHEAGRLKTVISALAGQCSSGGYVVNGPGGEARMGMPPTMPGTYKIDPRTGEKVAQKTVLPKKLIELVAVATGWGVEQNLVEMLLHVEKQRPLPETINLVGFSRGADACLRFANLMYQFYPQIKLNIMAIEPVPGTGRLNSEAATVIPTNVKNYVSTLALHENRVVFAPQDYGTLKPTDFESSHVECLPMPGHHGVHSHISDRHPGTEAASKLVQDMAISYLSSWGSTFRVDPRYPIKNTSEKVSIYERRVDTDPVGLLRKYATMLCDIDNYGPFSGVRYVASHREDYSPILPGCFINQHHLKLFSQQFPFTFQSMCDPDDESKKKNSNTELAGCPEIKEWLKKTFEDDAEEKTRIFFNPSRDCLDRNYLRVVMAVHALDKNLLIGGKEKMASKQLLQDCKNILLRPYSDKESEIARCVQGFIGKYPNSHFSRHLSQRFSAKELTLQDRTLHELRAALNQNLLQKIIEGVESFVSSKREKYYDVVRSSLVDAISIMSANPPPAQQQIVALLREKNKAILEARLVCGSDKESRAEEALGRLITHVSRVQTPVSQSQTQLKT